MTASLRLPGRLRNPRVTAAEVAAGLLHVRFVTFPFCSASARRRGNLSESGGVDRLLCGDGVRRGGC
jgi:hypothetical protein